MSVGVNIATVVRLGVVKRVNGAKVCELLKEVRHSSLDSGIRGMRSVYALAMSLT